MDLHSPKDKILLKNCIAVKLHMLKLAEESPTIEDEISYYENLRQILKADDTDLLFCTLKDTHFDETYRVFNQHILSTPAKEIAQEYIHLTKSLMLENGVYSDQKFEELKSAFFRGNEDLIDTAKTKNANQLEEEPDNEDTPNYLTKDEENYLKLLSNLLDTTNAKTISATDFKAFSEQFSAITLALGKSKFEQTFQKKGKHILDMQIAYNASDFSKPVYKTDFTLLDKENTKTTHSIREIASTLDFSSKTSYQTLCYSYLEASQAAKIDETLLDRNTILSKMATFSKCYQNLATKMPTCLFEVSEHSIIYLGVSNCMPNHELDIPCQKPQLDEPSL